MKKAKEGKEAEEDNKIEKYSWKDLIRDSEK